MLKQPGLINPLNSGFGATWDGYCLAQETSVATNVLPTKRVWIPIDEVFNAPATFNYFISDNSNVPGTVKWVYYLNIREPSTIRLETDTIDPDATDAAYWLNAFFTL